jgi:hypothetical protein
MQFIAETFRLSLYSAKLCRSAFARRLLAARLR